MPNTVFGDGATWLAKSLFFAASVVIAFIAGFNLGETFEAQRHVPPHGAEEFSIR